jgi:uncharacterized cupin superfamily protein
MERELREAMRGGRGSVELVHIFRSQELGGKARLFARLRLPKGSSIGYHIHEKEAEIFYILSGTGLLTEDGVGTAVSAGDAVLTGGGAGHAIETQDEQPLELLAVILLD